MDEYIPNAYPTWPTYSVREGDSIPIPIVTTATFSTMDTNSMYPHFSPGHIFEQENIAPLGNIIGHEWNNIPRQLYTIETVTSDGLQQREVVDRSRLTFTINDGEDLIVTIDGQRVENLVSISFDEIPINFRWTGPKKEKPKWKDLL